MKDKHCYVVKYRKLVTGLNCCTCTYCIVYEKIMSCIKSYNSTLQPT
jgi:hypothetical protein